MQSVWFDHKSIGFEFMQAIVEVGTNDFDFVKIPLSPASFIDDM